MAREIKKERGGGEREEERQRVRTRNREEGRKTRKGRRERVSQ